MKRNFEGSRSSRRAQKGKHQMIGHQFKIAGFIALFLVWAGTLASAQTNVALVIGNSAYQRPLPTTIADASAMAETMRGAGFDVTELRDIHRRDGGEIMNNFLNKIAGAEGKVTAFFYYTGYAAQVAGDNYLVPVDASIAEANDIRTQSLRLGEFLEQFARIPAAARIVVLDASYEHGFGRGTAQAVPPGLAIMQAPAGMAIASAAAPGEVATAEAGTYTRTLVALMRQPGLELDQIFKTARSQIHQVTGGKQTPWSATGLLVDVTLISAAPPAQALAVPAAPPAAEPPAKEPPATERTEPRSKKEQRRQAERPRHKRAAREPAAPAQARQDPAPPPIVGIGVGGIGIGRGGFGIGIGR
jgi:hypothetical protein